MICVTIDQLRRIMPEGKNRIPEYVDPLNQAMQEFEINTEARVEAFLSQIAHESGRFRYVEELASGAAYEGRKDLGNTQQGDGRRFKGRGLIQITGRANYVACMMALDIDCVNRPDLLEEPREACRSSAWFWHSRGLNALADRIDGIDDIKDFDAITRRINGGQNGRADRLAVWEIAKEVIV